ncbi:MAG: hypothetical protein KF833_15580 [Verrucomicrobiae bacterium]|nr:hypothetical protein [Verrucomicrobiae bacterium]
MKRPAFLDSPPLFLEFERTELRALHRDALHHWPLERTADGRLTDACRARVIAQLAALVRAAPWQPRPRAWCALPAQGVALRRLTLPQVPAPERHRLVALQVESEFPLAPEALAWGHAPLPPQPGATPDAAPSQPALVAAARRDLIDHYAALLHEAGLAPAFVPAALARAQLLPDAPAPALLLHVGEHPTELLLGDAAGPESLRVLSLHADALVHALEPATPNAPSSPAPAPIPDPLETLIRALPDTPGQPRLFLSGTASRHPALVARLPHALGLPGLATPLDEGPGAPSSALRGLQQLVAQGRSSTVPQLATESAPASSQPWWQRLPRPWLAAAAVLLLAWLTLPYLEASLRAPGLAARLDTLKSERQRLAVIDRQYDFLRHLQQNQAPYLDALLVLGKTAPPGTRVESIAMNLRGELVLRGVLRNSQEVVDFRTKLVDSGFFSSVVIEEQSPAPNRQNLNFRISAQWKPASARAGLPILKEDPATPAPVPGAAGSTGPTPVARPPTPRPG